MHRSVLALAAAALALSGCDFINGGGGGGGTGGGSGTSIPFTDGFTFVRKDDRNVYLVDDDDPNTVGTLTTTANVRTPSFSADKARVVFVRGTGESSEIAVVPVAGGAASVVVTATSAMRDLRTPVFSPDGTTIAFGYSNNGTGEIGLVNVDGTNLRSVPANGVLAYASPTFTPDGTAVLVAAGNSGLGLTQIERITLSTGMAVNVTNTLGSEAMDIAGRIVISPDGTKATFDARVSTGESRIFLIDLGSKAVTRLSTGELGANDSFPCWMNNTTIAYSSEAGGNDNLYQVGLTGSPSFLLPKAVEPWYSR
ncbi:MAG: TolB family protein [Archangium sp.]